MKSTLLHSVYEINEWTRLILEVLRAGLLLWHLIPGGSGDPLISGIRGCVVQQSFESELLELGIFFGLGLCDWVSFLLRNSENEL